MEKDATSATVMLKGIPASPGVVTGKAWIFSQRDIDIPSDRIDEGDAEMHLENARNALCRVEDQLKELQQSLDDSEIIDILDAQLEIIKDPELLKRVDHLVRNEKRTSKYALYSAFNEFIQLLHQTGQDWVRDRIIDLQSLRDKIIHHAGGSDVQSRFDGGSVIFAEELSPTEVIEFQESEIAAIVMQHGGTTSHAVIIAQSLGIPCVVGVDWRRTQLIDAVQVAVDAASGEIIINPDQKILADFRNRQQIATKRNRYSAELSRQPNRTLCGESFQLRANIEFKEELNRVKEFGAEGIGLLRTETLFLQQGFFDVRRHVQLYRSVLTATEDHPVTIRLLDVGGDKLPGKKLDEANPFLGWRGIRMLLDEHEVLKSQLRAILTLASEFPGRVRILVPMVSDICEIKEVRNRISEVLKELHVDLEADVPAVPVGIMVEVPAIALQAEAAAGTADFFSIGSNDLTQYILAADRGNERVSRNFNSAHPAVWKLILMTYDAAEKAGIPVSVCGEMAGNPILAAALLGMGFRELSMNPSSIPTVKQLLCSHEIKIFRELLESLLQTSGGNDADRRIESWKKKYLNRL